MSIEGSTKRSLIAAVTVIVVAIIVSVTAVLVIPRMSSSSNGGGSTGGGTTLFASKTMESMPSNAAKESTDWFVSVLKKLKGKYSDDFFNSDAGTKILDQMAAGNFDTMPKEVQQAVAWTEDMSGRDSSSSSTNKTVSFTQMRASSYTALIMAWQLYDAASQQASKNGSTLSVQTGLVSVDKSHGVVYVPMEAICGVPVDLTFQLKWEGDGWKIDGDMVANQIAAKARSNQLQSIVKEEQNSNSNDGNTNSNQ